ncbi:MULTISPECIES: potassium channel family protein [Citrobacter]|uniref:potassium channel family protein n=1 Tax=Citrobacter TaxID=544 RepID=UPI0023B12B53|nr:MULTISPECIES: potassium channel family protein [Citrobacter]MDM3082809.1 potassium channel family protein [Citrobacter sp. Cf141]
MDYFNCTAEQFNQMRRNEDYPSLYNLFSQELPRFDEWMADQNITKEMMFQHGLARFIISDVNIYLCLQQREHVLWEHGVMDFKQRKKSGWIKNYAVYRPYFLWLRKHVCDREYISARNGFRINTFKDNHHYFMGKVPLRNIGGRGVRNANLSGKLLDFVSLDNLVLESPHNNMPLYVYCSSAVRLRITGGVAFLKFKECSLSEIQINHNGLVLEHGSYQDLSFDRCQVDLKLTSANMMHLNVSNCNFKVVCDFARFDSQCRFSYDRNNKYSYQSESEFYTEVTNLFSESNDYASAGENYYKKRRALMLESLWPWGNFQNATFRMNKAEKKIFRLKTFFNGFLDVFNFLCWGFGEKPSRSLAISFAVILLSSMVYYFNEQSSTHTLVEALYFSIVSFTTLGFGDITQKSSFLRLFSALESLCGLILMGLFLAGFASKTKRY